MFCPNCGTKLEDGAVFCTSCGVRIAQDTPTPVQPEQPADSAQQPLQSEAPVQQPAPAEQPDIWHQAANDAPEDTWQQPTQDQQPPFEQPIVTNTVPGGAAPKDYLVVNIVLTALCFLCCSCINFFGLITGIIGIVSSSQVRKAVAAGDLALADRGNEAADGDGHACCEVAAAVNERKVERRAVGERIACGGCIAGVIAHQRRPCNPDLRVVPRQTAFIVRVPEIVDFVTKFRFVRQHQKPVREPFRNQKLLFVFRRQRHAVPLAVRRRPGAQIDRHVEHFAAHGAVQHYHGAFAPDGVGQQTALQVRRQGGVTRDVGGQVRPAFAQTGAQGGFVLRFA